MSKSWRDNDSPVGAWISGLAAGWGIGWTAAFVFNALIYQRPTLWLFVFALIAVLAVPFLNFPRKPTTARKTVVTPGTYRDRDGREWVVHNYSSAAASSPDDPMRVIRNPTNAAPEPAHREHYSHLGWDEDQ